MCRAYGCLRSSLKWGEVRDGRCGSVTQSAVAAAARSVSAAGIASAAATPNCAATVGIDTAAVATPRGCAIWRIPIAVPRRCTGNHPMTRRPLAALALPAAMPPASRMPASATGPEVSIPSPRINWYRSGPAIAAAPALSPIIRVIRSPARSTSKPHNTRVSMSPAVVIAATVPAAASVNRYSPLGSLRAGMRNAPLATITDDAN